MAKPSWTLLSEKIDELNELAKIFVPEVVLFLDKESIEITFRNNPRFAVERVNEFRIKVLNAFNHQVERRRVEEKTKPQSRGYVWK